MVFQKLDVQNRAEVPCDVFIEGLIRMKTKVKGIDVATAKSWMRRLVLEGFALRMEGLQCHQCFKAIVEKLRGVQVADMTMADVYDEDDKIEEELHDEEQEAHFLVGRQGMLRQENERMQRKIIRMRQHAEKRKLLLKEMRMQFEMPAREYSLTSGEEGAD